MAGKLGKVGTVRSKSSAKKRIKKTQNGKGNYKCDKAAHNHLLLQKSKKQKAKARLGVMIDSTHNKQIQKMLPNL